MGVLNLGIGIVGLIILFGILSAGSTSEITEKYSDMNIINTLDFDTFLDELDYNIINKLDVSFEDKNIPISFKKTIHYVGRGIIDGLCSSIYAGKLVNDMEPGIYVWVKANLWLTFGIVILLLCPSTIHFVMICILGLLLILKERFIKKEHKKPKNTWRD